MVFVLQLSLLLVLCWEGRGGGKNGKRKRKRREDRSRKEGRGFLGEDEDGEEEEEWIRGEALWIRGRLRSSLRSLFKIYEKLRQPLESYRIHSWLQWATQNCLQGFQTGSKKIKFRNIMLKTKINLGKNQGFLILSIAHADMKGGGIKGEL